MPDETADQTTEIQSIEKLKERYDELNTRRIQAETHLTSAKSQLEQLQAQAQKEYGTDDLTELRTKLDTMKKDNEKKRSDYQQQLDRIEGDLANVESRYSAQEQPADGEEIAEEAVE